MTNFSLTPSIVEVELKEILHFEELEISSFKGKPYAIVKGEWSVPVRDSGVLRATSQDKPEFSRWLEENDVAYEIVTV